MEQVRGNPSVKLAWLRPSAAGAFAHSAGRVSFPEYLKGRLLGVRRCSISIGSGSGLMNVRRGVCDEEATAIASMRSGLLSPLVDAGEPATGCA
jgi:gluconokinase